MTLDRIESKIKQLESEIKAKSQSKTKSSDSLDCPKCKGLVAVFYARDFEKDPTNVLGDRNKKWAVIKIGCPAHGEFKIKLRNSKRATWINQFAESLKRCMKCERLGTLEKQWDRREWIILNIACPKHGVTKTRKIISSLYQAAQHPELDITYGEIMEIQAPSTTPEQISPVIKMPERVKEDKSIKKIVEEKQSIERSSRCPNCGSLARSDSRFCGKCGIKLSA